MSITNPEFSDYTADTDALSEKDGAIAARLLADKDKILRQLAEAGIHEDTTSPYTYFVPTWLSFDIGKLAGGFSIRSLYAIVLMARASYARACFLDCDDEGMPELPQFTLGGKIGFHRVKITDPFAMQIDAAIRDSGADAPRGQGSDSQRQVLQSSLKTENLKPKRKNQ